MLKVFRPIAHTPGLVLGACTSPERSLSVKLEPGFSDTTPNISAEGYLLQHIVVFAPTMRRILKKASSSAKPTKTPPPTPASQTVESGKQGLTAIRPPVKDLSVLAASTSAIALSFAPPPCDPADTALDETGSSQESHWGTAYEAAKMAIDFANASSDMFLPLKAVVGALSVLIKNYDVSCPRASCPIEC